MKPDRLTTVLEAILERLGRLEDTYESSKKLMEQLVELAKEHASEMTSLRSRMIEDSSRKGSEIADNVRAITDLKARVSRLEHPANGKATG